VSSLTSVFKGSSLRSELYAEKVLIEGLNEALGTDGIKEGEKSLG